jgi:hypothetical protein
MIAIWFRTRAGRTEMISRMLRRHDMMRVSSNTKMISSVAADKDDDEGAGRIKVEKDKHDSDTM